MSYDIYLRADKCPTCGKRGDEPDLPNPTYNLTPIFDYVITRGEPMPNHDVSECQVVLFRAKTDRPRGLRLLDGRVAKDTIDWLKAAREFAGDPANEAALRALEPPNGWGDLAGARKVLDELFEAAREYPENTWEVH